MSAAIVVPAMTAAEARACVARINAHVAGVRAELWRLEQAEGWRALGYDSMQTCMAAEFAQGQAALYRQLQAARIEARVSSVLEIGAIPARQLIPLDRLPEEERADAWAEAVATAPSGKLTGAHVAAVVGLRRPGASTTPPEDRDFWRTPPARFAELAGRFGPFALDAAAEAHTALCPAWFGPGSPWGEDALAACWRLPGDAAPTRVFCNPPYSRGNVERFARKAHAEALAGHARSTLLINVVTDQPWFHELAWDNDRGESRPGVRVRHFIGRVRFLRPNGQPAGSPEQPSMAVTFLAPGEVLP